MMYDASGRALAGLWSSGMSAGAFRGTTAAGFPNLFVLTGPNIGPGHSSQVFMIEAQIRYITDAVAHARRRGAVRVEVRPAAQAAYDRILQKKMERTVWVTGGCKSWYLDAVGRNVTLWPDFTWAFAWQTRRFDAASYDVRISHPQ